MKILSSFTHPQVVPNLYECLCSAEHKGRYSEECGKQSSSGAPLTSIVFFFLLWKSMVPKTAWLQTFFKISSFVFSRTKKFIQVWNYLRVSKWWQNFHFWVNYPFNVTSFWNNKKKCVCSSNVLVCTSVCSLLSWFFFHWTHTWALYQVSYQAILLL